MIEDKLDQEQRLRLECLAQAIAHAHGSPMRATAVSTIIVDAKRLEDYVRGVES